MYRNTVYTSSVTEIIILAKLEIRSFAWRAFGPSPFCPDKLGNPIILCFVS